MTLSANEFIRRFLLHFLPKRFRKIRYGGFLARSVYAQKLEQARSFLTREASKSPMGKIETEITDYENDAIERCPKCQIGTMRAIDIDKESRVRNWQAYIGCS